MSQAYTTGFSTNFPPEGGIDAPKTAFGDNYNANQYDEQEDNDAV